jgi:hypothetical protein
MGVLRADGLRVLEADFARVVGSRFGDADSVRICRRVGLAAEFAGRRDLGDRLDVELLRWAGQFPIICDRDSFDCLWRGLPGLVRVVAIIVGVCDRRRLVRVGRFRTRLTAAGRCLGPTVR